MAKTVVGLFDDYQQAQSAVQQLRNAGIPDSDISLVAHDNAIPTAHHTDTDHHTGDSAATGAGTGATIGAVAGGAAGLLAGIGAIVIPGFGPVVAAGWLVSTLTGAGIGAAAGAAIGGLAGALTSVGVPEEEAGYYEEGVRRGGALITVRAEDALAERAASIMDSAGAVDIDRRGEYYRSTGYAGSIANAQPYDADAIARDRAAYQSYQPGMATAGMATAGTTAMANTAATTTQDINRGGEVAIPVVEEELHVGKRQVQSGGARIHTHMTETPVQEQVNLREEHVSVERRPVDRPITNADMSAFKEGTIEVTETAEVPVVQKEARVVEEVVVGKRATERTETIQDTVRRTDVDVENLTGTAQGTTMGSQFSGAFDNYTNDYRSHWQNYYGTQGGRYEDYEPAYRYGHSLAGNSQYQGQDWSRIENNIQTDWNRLHPNTWDRMKNSIRYAWERATGDHTPGVQTGGRAIDGTPDTRGLTEKAADAVTGDRVDDKTGRIVR